MINQEKFILKKSNWKKIIRILSFFVLCLIMGMGISYAQTTQQQGITISGNVIDNAGDPMPGVSVFIPGTNIGTATDINGAYSLLIPNEQVVLEFAYLGYITHRETAGNRRVINIELKEDIQRIEEVVVLGYGTQKKVTLSGAVSAMGTTELLKAPVPNVAHALAGNLSGISTIQFSGQPGGDDPTIFIRGQGSLDADRSAPLYMVDGVERSFFQLDPNEIESISILKDASATAVFGVRGANGVVLVTTKRGQSGKPKISVTLSAGLQNPLHVLPYVDSYTFGTRYNEALMNDGTPADQVTFTPQLLEAFRTGSDPLVYPNTNWMDLTVRSLTPQTQHNVNISGGTDQVRYFISIGYLNQGGIFRSFEDTYDANWKYDRYNYRANLDIDVTKTTLLKVNLGGRSENRHNPNLDAGTFWRDMQYALPFGGAGLVDGKHIRANTENVNFPDLGNGDGFRMYGRGYGDVLRNIINLDIALTQKLDMITQGLSFSVKGAYNNTLSHTVTHSKSEPTWSAHRDLITNELYFRKSGDGSPTFGFSESMSRARDWYLEGSFNYARSFGKHNVSALALYNQSRFQYPQNVDYPGIPRGYVGLVGRITYDFNSRYLADFNVGYNGSENFHRDHRYGLFPAISGGWIMSEEDFMKEATLFNYLKLRASYGLVGNDLYARNRFFYLPDAYNPNSMGYNFGTNVPESPPTAVELRLGNRNVSWEVARKQNYGIDFVILNSQLSGSFDYFIEKRSDILISRNTIPTHVAVLMPVMNLGKTENKGVEGVLKWTQKIGDFRYTLGANVTFAKGKVIYKDEIPRNYDWRYETGKPIDQAFGYTFDGLVTQADLDGGKLPDHAIELKVGDAKYKDLNGDGVIDGDDISAIGYSKWPQVAGGFTIGFEYKKFDFSTMWAGVARVSRYLSEHYRVPFGDTRNRTAYTYMFDNHWTPERAQTATTPRLSFNNAASNYRDSDLWLKDGSYLRLRNLQIGYNINGNWLQKAGISNLRLYSTGENLLTFDHIKVFDPESSDGRNYDYPLLRVVTLGINITF